MRYLRTESRCNCEEDFRPKRLKQATGTEVTEGTEGETSVPNDEYGLPGRKSQRMQREKLPSQTMKTGRRDGSHRGCREGNFRPKYLKRGVRTEVSNSRVFPRNIKHQEMYDHAFPDVSFFVISH